MPNAKDLIDRIDKVKGLDLESVDWGKEQENNNNKKRVLLAAIAKNNVDVIKWMVNSGFDLKWELSPKSEAASQDLLLQALNLDNAEILKLLIESGAPLSKDALWSAVSTHVNQIELFKDIASSNRAVLNECILTAIKNDKNEELAILFKQFKIDPNLKLKEGFWIRTSSGTVEYPWVQLLDIALLNNSKKVVSFLMSQPGINLQGYPWWPSSAWAWKANKKDIDTFHFDPEAGKILLSEMVNKYSSTRDKKRKQIYKSSFNSFFYDTLNTRNSYSPFDSDGENTDLKIQWAAKWFDELIKPMLDHLDSYEGKKMIYEALVEANNNYRSEFFYKYEKRKLVLERLQPYFYNIRLECESHELIQALYAAQKTGNLSSTIQEAFKDHFLSVEQLIKNKKDKDNIMKKYTFNIISAIPVLYERTQDENTAVHCRELLLFAFNHLPTTSRERAHAAECLASMWLNDAEKLKNKEGAKKHYEKYLHKAIAAYRIAGNYMQADVLFKKLIWGEEVNAFTAPSDDVLKLNMEKIRSVNHRVCRAMLEEGLVDSQNLSSETRLNQPFNEEAPKVDIKLDMDEVKKPSSVSEVNFSMLFSALGHKYSEKGIRKSQLALCDKVMQEFNANPTLTNLNRFYGALQFLGLEAKGEHRFTSDPSRLEWLLLQEKRELEAQFRARGIVLNPGDANRAFTSWAEKIQDKECKKALKHLPKWKRDIDDKQFDHRLEKVWAILEKRQEKAARKRNL